MKEESRNATLPNYPMGTVYRQIFGDAQVKKSQAPSPLRMKSEAGAADLFDTRTVGGGGFRSKAIERGQLESGLLEAADFFIRHTLPEVKKP